VELRPEDLLSETWVPEYKRRITVLHNQLAQIRSTHFVLEQIARFPFDIFNEHPGPFWGIVRRSLETAVVIGLWRVLLDTDGDSLTLRQLKNQVMVNARDAGARARLADELRTRHVNTGITDAEAKLARLRHKYFAHLDAVLATGPVVVASATHLSFLELNEVVEAAAKLLNAIGMGTYYMTLYPDYDPTVTRGDERIVPDVELILNGLAERSSDLRLPESKPYEFTFYWKNRTSEQRQAFNAYRKKFNLSEISL